MSSRDDHRFGETFGDDSWAAAEPEAQPFAGRPASSAGTWGQDTWSGDDVRPEPVALLLPDADSVDRYEDCGLLGRGGMGEVRRVRDRVLGRTMAMKVLSARFRDSEYLRARFQEEGQLTAQLQHPGIVPVHDMGLLPDGRLWFTMKEVRGATFDRVISRVHVVSEGGAWRSTDDGWTLHRLVRTLHAVCEAVAYAHSRGVVHRDLKPANLMVGEFGAVHVMDWGLAGINADISDHSEVFYTVREGNDRLATRVGVFGTPHFMPPEQARGELAALGPGADVYALGAVLYQVLTDGPPFQDLRPDDVLHALRAGLAPPPVEEAAAAARAPAPPSELVAICGRAMSPVPADRYADAGALALALAAWLDGERRRERARALVDEATALLPEVARLRREAAADRLAAAELLRGQPRLAPVEQRRPAWVLERRGEDKELRADRLELGFLQTLRAALNVDPDLREAHRALAAHHRREHAAAEAAGDARAAATAEALLREHDRGEHAEWLAGEGRLSVVCDPPDARATLFRLVERDRRWEPTPLGEPLTAPIEGLPLPVGRYVVRLSAPGCHDLVVAVVIERMGHWDGLRPGAAAPEPLRLARLDELGPDEVLVPAGPAWLGGRSPGVGDSPPRLRTWVDAFVIDRHPVTNGRYVSFLNDLVARGEGERAELLSPRDFNHTTGTLGAPVLARDADGRFLLGKDHQGHAWHADDPVILVDAAGAEAFAAWEAARTGLPWRLPVEAEWEKAARGVDGRIYPWGDHLEPVWCCMRYSHTGEPRTARVGAHPDDRSVWGVEGLAGNVADLCAGVYRPEGPPGHGHIAARDPAACAAAADQRRPVRGGAWFFAAVECRSDRRLNVPPGYRSATIGFRLVRALPSSPE